MVFFLYTLLLIDTLNIMHLALIIFKLSLDPKFNKQLKRRTKDMERNLMRTLYTLLPIPVLSLIRLALIVFRYQSIQIFIGQTDGLTERRTEGRTVGKPIVPSGVNTGSGLTIFNISIDLLVKVIN